MFVIWKRINKKLFRYPITFFERQTAEGMYLLMTAPFPRNDRQKQKLIRALRPYKGKTVPPQDVATERLGTFYSTKAFETRILLKAFLNLCCTERPEAAAIYFSEHIHEEYYFRLCETVERLYIIGGQSDFSLCIALLSHNGTPLVYTEQPPAGAAVLNITEQQTAATGPGGFCCDRSLFHKGNDIFPAFLNREFSGVDRLALAAAMQEQWGNQNVLAEFSAAAEREIKRQISSDKNR